MRPLSTDAVRVLERGTVCSLGVATTTGPHVTPVVYAWSGGDVWLTTARASAKARATRADPRVAGLVRFDDAAVAFAGPIRVYDALEPETWASSIAASPALLAAAMRFGRKNARFYAGYAVDALHIPLPWTPPGRLFARVSIQRAALLDRGRRTLWGRWPRAQGASAAVFRSPRGSRDVLAGVPPDVAARIGTGGSEAALGVEGPNGPTVIPAGWIATGGAVYAAIPAVAAELVVPGSDGRVALAVDRASSWRARDMAGVMVQGEALSYPVDALAGGRVAAARLVRSAGLEAGGAVLVRISPRRVVWWRGWASGSVVPGARPDGTARPAAARP